MAEQPETEQGVIYASNGDPAQMGYIESSSHVPDPTAMSGTLETSGTGGGANERITGPTRIFGRLKAAAPGPDEGDPTEPSEADVKPPAKKTTAKK